MVCSKKNKYQRIFVMASPCHFRLLNLFLREDPIPPRTEDGIEYRKPPNISPGLIFVRKHFWVGLYMEGGAYIQGGLYTDEILC